MPGVSRSRDDLGGSSPSLKRTGNPLNLPSCMGGNLLSFPLRSGYLPGNPSHDPVETKG